MSPTPLQSETARVNGAKSNGPVTADGKATSAMNSLKHGLCSKQVVLPGEDQGAFDRLQADYIRIYKPQGPAETELVETIAASSWRLKRIIRIETAILSDDNADPIKSLGLLIRYEGQLNRTYDQSIKRLQVLQENRPDPSLAPGDRPLAPALRNEPKPPSVRAEPELIKPINLPAPRPAAFNPALKHPGAGV